MLQSVQFTGYATIHKGVAQVKGEAHVRQLAKALEQLEDRFVKELPVQAEVVFHNSQKNDLLPDVFGPNSPTEYDQASLMYHHRFRQQWPSQEEFVSRIDLPERGGNRLTRWLNIGQGSLQRFVETSLEAAKQQMDTAKFFRAYCHNERYGLVGDKLVDVLKQVGYPATERGFIGIHPSVSYDGVVLIVSANTVAEVKQVLLSAGCENPQAPLKQEVVMFDDVPVYLVPWGKQRGIFTSAVPNSYGPNIDLYQFKN